MKFAFLSKRYYTNKDILDDRFGRLFHLPDQLGKMGNDGLVITGDLHGKREEKRRINGLDYYSKPLSAISLYGFIKYTWQILKKERPQVLICSGDTYWGYIGFHLAKRLGIPFVFDVYDDYTAFGTNKIPGMKKLFFHTVKSADLIIASGSSIKDFLSPFNRSILVIENGIDPQIFKPIPRMQARSELGIAGEDTVIGYFGSIAHGLGVDLLIEAGGLLGRRTPGLRLLIAGRNNMHMDFSGFDFVDYRGSLPQRTVPLLINACNVVVIPYPLNKTTKICTACKLAEYLACGVPIVATRVSYHAEVFSPIPQALCEPGDAGSLELAIDRQLNSPRIMPLSNGLTWNRLAEKLLIALENLINRQGV